MIRNINILVLCLFVQLSFAQIIWLEPTSSNSKEILIDRVTQKEYAINPTDKNINYHKSIGIVNPIQINLGETNLNQCNIYTVYRPSGHAEEQLIWSVQSQSQDQLTLTDRRMVDYTKSKFMNFLDRSPMEVQINNYQHYQNAYPGDQLLIGGLPSNKEVPVKSLTGDIAEMIVFDQMLAPMAKQQMESYLALKYSIPLAENLDYVDGNADVIWRANNEKTYNNHIAGIGRDSRTSLNQKQSRSTFGNGSLSIGVVEINDLNKNNTNELADQEYLLWSDDDGLIDYEAKEAQNPILKRKWKFFTKRYQSEQEIVLRLEHNDLIEDLDPDERLWLIMDTSGDEFEMSESEFILLQEDNNYLQSESFTMSNQNDMHFSFMKAPQMWAAIDLIQPNCGTDNGAITLKAIGGKAPYTILISSEEEETEITLTEDNDNYKIEKLVAGEYEVHITDADQKQWTKTFYLNHNEIEIPDLKNVYHLHKEKITIDANPKKINDYEYQWLAKNESISNQSETSITQSGIYKLIIADGDCIYQKNIEVIALEDNIQSITLYPNPTSTGHFELYAALKESTPYNITISDLSGRLIYSQDYPEAKYIEWNNWIQRSGMYLITLQSGNDIETRKLVVKNK